MPLCFLKPYCVGCKCCSIPASILLCIAAASILAKTYRDEWINKLVDENPELEKYDLRNNKGYGTKKHLDAIKKYGITRWHRKSFGICKE